MADKGLPAHRVLPKKESDMFKSVMRFYEQKVYKKGLKAADGVLKKFPNHGETLAMKGLILNCMAKKEEAYDLVKKGLRADLTSHVCWHVFGLLHRSDRNYNEAIKCYLNALRHDPENMQILRDLSHLQIQLRELRGFVDTRCKILGLKSNIRINWMAYAVANDVAGQQGVAINVLDAFMKTTKDMTDTNYEDSELHMYRNQLLSEKGDTEEALTHLDSCESMVMDKIGWILKRGELLLACEQHGAAEKLLRDLFARGTDNYGVHRGLQCAVLNLTAAESCEMMKLKACDLPSDRLILSDEQTETLSSLYSSMQSEYPKSAAMKRIPLGFLKGEAFSAALEAYIRDNLTRGVPGLGTDISSLFTMEAGGRKVVALDPVDLIDNSVVNAVIQLCDTYIAALNNEGKLPGSEKEEPKSTILWTSCLKSHMLEKQGKLAEALELANFCIEHTPAMVDMYQRKARVLKKMGDVSQAADVMEEARKLDTSDRYVNNKTTKYLLRANRIQQAESTVALFTRHEGDPQYYLFEMQCSWYELEWAASHLRQGKLGPCLKKARAVEKHFQDFVEDQFDFHSYCMRKMTLRAYVAMLRMEDNIHGHHFFRRAADLAVRAYLQIHDKPETASESAEVDYSNMSATEKKKAKAKARKDAKKAAAQVDEEKRKRDEEISAAAQAAEAKAQAEKEQHSKENGDGDDTANDVKKKKRGRGGKEIPVDNDPHGAQLAATAQPLEDAAQFTHILRKQAAGHLGTWMLGFDVALRRGKYLLALQALVKGFKIAPQEPELMYRTAQLFHKLESIEGTDTAPSPLAARVIADEGTSLLHNKSLADYVTEFSASEAALQSLPGRMCAARAVLLMGKEGCKGKAVGLVHGGLDKRGASVIVCSEAITVLEQEVQDEAAAAAFKASCHSKYPFAPAFADPNSKENSL